MTNIGNVMANWTGSCPNLCRGKWQLKVNDKWVSDKIPEDLRDDSMDTYGRYEKWNFAGGYNAVNWENYFDGLQCDEWIKENKKWLDSITTDDNIQRDIFEAISEEDFRHGSCGGCI